MPRILPSQAVELIELMFPDVKRQAEGQAVSFQLSSGYVNEVAAITAIVDQIPPELITLQGKQLTQFVTCLHILKSAVVTWQTQGSVLILTGTSVVPRLNPLTCLRNVLIECRDTYPSPHTAELTFIDDPELRQSLRLDMSGIERMVANADWKAATVLAGSVIEALLYWAVKKKPDEEIQQTVSKLAGKGKELNQWLLPEFIEVAAAVKIIAPPTVAQCRLAKDFRNLIHPGRAVRLGQNCNKGTALGAVAAMELVVEDLQASSGKVSVPASTK